MFHICPTEVAALLANMPMLNLFFTCCRECLRGCLHKTLGTQDP